jgi:hypothetical protein
VRPRVRPHGRLENNRGDKSVSESAIKWMSARGSTKRQCDRALVRPEGGADGEGLVRDRDGVEVVGHAADLVRPVRLAWARAARSFSCRPLVFIRSICMCSIYINSIE